MNAFTHYCVIAPSEIAVARLPKDICRLEAPIFELAIAAYRAVHAADVEGKRVLILGLGPSGLIMAQLCRALGAELVSGWDLYEMRRTLGTHYGCADFDGQYDIVIDAFGDDVSPGGGEIDRAIARMKDFGTLVLYGHPVSGRTVNSYLLQKKQINVKMPVNNMKVIQTLADRTVRHYLDGELNFAELVTKTIQLDGVIDALELLQKEPEKHIKIIVLNEEDEA
jgi:threonine dehydrogenase-like Zn-dependent dehydrogenase